MNFIANIIKIFFILGISLIFSIDSQATILYQIEGNKEEWKMGRPVAGSKVTHLSILGSPGYDTSEDLRMEWYFRR